MADEVLGAFAVAECGGHLVLEDSILVRPSAVAVAEAAEAVVAVVVVVAAAVGAVVVRVVVVVAAVAVEAVVSSR